uniref:Uncharacterized protein n=1 Tax=Anopheles darlingi TaxID=43151 RepID=A0A2M4DQ22_ANODA
MPLSFYRALNGMRHTIVLLSFHFLYSHAPSLARLAFIRIYIKPCNNDEDDDNTHITLAYRKALILRTTDTYRTPCKPWHPQTGRRACRGGLQ